MPQVVLVALPFFVVVFLGYGARQFRVLEQASISGLNAYVLYFALPALLFRTVAATPLDNLLNGRFIAAYLTAGLGVYGLAVLSAWLCFRASPGALGIHGLAAAWPNTGYMGLPLISAILGRQAITPLIVAITLEITVLMALTVALLEADRGHGGKPLDAFLTTLKGLRRNPILMATLAGLILSATGLELSGPLDDTIELLGRTAGPCALFALGASLVGKPLAGGVDQIAHMIAFKLFLHPVAVAVTVNWLFPLEPLWATTLELNAMLPIAGTVYVLAQGYQIGAERAASAVLLSTVLSMATVTVWLVVNPGA